MATSSLIVRLLRKSVAPALMCLTACASSPRIGLIYDLQMSGYVSKKSIPEFIECVTDSFRKIDQSAFAFTPHSTFPERRATGHRIGIRGVAQGSDDAIVKADVRDDGFVEVSAVQVGMMPPSHYRAGAISAANGCLAMYKTTAPS